MSKKTVTVIGSYNVGLFLKGEVLPRTGETIISHTFQEGGGGKGSNQAIAASCLGADVVFIGRVGKDKYGEAALALYDAYGVSRERITVDSTIHTGISVILIDAEGRNMISVVPGANLRLSTEDIDKAEDVLKHSAIVGFQLESDFDTVAYGLKTCARLGVPTLLDPAPARKLPESLLPLITYLKPNEHEASLITGMEVTDRDSALSAAMWLVDRGVKHVIITLGDQGSVLVNDGRQEWFPSLSVKAVDTTGAGDCFSGGLMCGLTKGMSLENAVRYATVAAGLSVTRIGVIESIPTVEEVNKQLEAQGLRELIV